MQYSVKFDAAFCFPCRNFESKARGDFWGMRCVSTFTTDGYRNRKQATEMNKGFSMHAASKEHSVYYNTWKERMKGSEMGEKITSLVNTEAIERNRCYFPTSIDIIAFLTTHQLAFRRKVDAFEYEDEGGNGLFLALFTLLKKASVYVQLLKLSQEMQRTPSRYAKQTYCCYELSGNRGY